MPMTTRLTLASLFIALGLIGILASPELAFAQRSSAGESALNFLDATAEKGGLAIGIKPAGFSSEDAVLGIVGNIINVVLGFVGVIFFVQMFYAGFRWMSAGGNEEVISESKQTVKNTIIGIAVVFGAFVVTNFTLNQIADITGPTRPRAPIDIDSEGLSGDNVYCSYVRNNNFVCEIMSGQDCLGSVGGTFVSRDECEADLGAGAGDLDFGALPPPPEQLGSCTARYEQGSWDEGNEAVIATASCAGPNLLELEASAAGDRTQASCQTFAESLQQLIFPAGPGDQPFVLLCPGSPVWTPSSP